MTYSEHELEFTFAKNGRQLGILLAFSKRTAQDVQQGMDVII